MTRIPSNELDDTFAMFLQHGRDGFVQFGFLGGAAAQHSIDNGGRIVAINTSTGTRYGKGTSR